MTIRQTLFSFQGRLNRTPWWVTFFFAFLLILLVHPLVFGLCWAIVSGGDMSMSFKSNRSSESGTGATSFSMPGGAEAAFAADVIVTLIFLWPSLAVCVKRLHDFNMSGYLIVVPNLLCGEPVSSRPMRDYWGPPVSRQRWGRISNRRK